MLWVTLKFPCIIPRLDRWFDYCVAVGGIIGLIGENRFNVHDKLHPYEDKLPDIRLAGCRNTGKLTTHDDYQIYLTGDMVGNTEVPFKTE